MINNRRKSVRVCIMLFLLAVAAAASVIGFVARGHMLSAGHGDGDLSEANPINADWTFFINDKDSNTLYKQKNDSGDQTKLSDDGIVPAFSLSGDWIYYLHLDGSDGVFKLSKVKTDGSARALVCGADFMDITPDDEVHAYIEKDRIIFVVTHLREPTVGAGTQTAEPSPEQRVWAIRLDGTGYENIS